MSNMLRSAHSRWSWILAALSLATVAPGLFLSFEDSEIWGITSSRRLLDDPWHISSAHDKPLFSLILAFVQALARSDWSTLVAARWLTVSLAAGAVFTWYSMALDDRRSRRDQWQGLALLGAVATMPLLVFHLTRVRSDLFAASAALLGLFFLTEFRGLLRRGIILTVSTTAVLLLTPKSIDLALGLSLFYLLTCRTGQRASSRLHRWLWAFAGPCLLALGALVISRGTVIHALSYWLDSYRDQPLTGANHWSALLETFRTAPLASLLLGGGLISSFLFWRRLSRHQLGLLAMSTVTIGFVLLHSQKFPFFLASRLPIIALGALPGWMLFISRQSTSKKRRLVVVAYAALCLGQAVSLLWHLGAAPATHQAFRIDRQRELHSELLDYIQRSGTRNYWDGIGLFPKTNTIFHYPSPSDRNNEVLLEYVELQKPQLILQTSKMGVLQPQLLLWLQQNYVELSPAVWTRAVTLSARSQSGRCLTELSSLQQQVQATGLQPPFALVVQTGSVERWVRVPFEFAGGARQDSLEFNQTMSENVRLLLPDCEKPGIRFALTAAGPWSALPAPDFASSFSYDPRF